ncbi:hypothetical protein MMC07_002517 [Pseudocyphellaria aurata]|nr:hypothetical protein [Pseudocyphellaria aurata]
MSQRPTLKLKLSTVPPPAESPSVPTPSSGTTKIKLKLGSNPKTSVPPSPAPALPPKAKPSPRKPKKDKPIRIRTPTAKKRDLATLIHSDEEEDVLTAPASKPAPVPQVKRIKLNTRAPSTPFIRLKGRGRPPTRPLGVGYDSEASDREEDPAIEEEFILRMTPGPDCDYLRQAVLERRFGPKAEGGADVRMRFLRSDGRRAVVTVQGRHYAACLVDLPCVIEGMKSWDKRSWWKSADVCQMLIVLGRVDKEDDALVFPLPTRDLDEKTWQYAHGLTPPTRWVRRRRFRKRVSNRTIEAVEEEVERLCKEDDDCEGVSQYEVLDLDRMMREQDGREDSEVDGGYNMLGNAGMQGGLEYGEQDAEGDLDDTPEYFEGGEGDEGDDGLEADLERAMMMDYDANETPESTITLAQPPPEMTTSPSAIATPSKEDSGDEEESSEEDLEPSEMDEEALERQQDMQRQREEIADLESAIKSQEVELERLQNPILKQKLMKKIQSLRADLGLKKTAIGEGVED